jgi:Ca2+-binding EF-hand superfamily protein
MNLRTIVLLGAVAVLLATGSDSLAQDPKSKNTPMKAALEGRFDLLDANKDGKVCREEYVKFHMKRAKERFDKVDKNNDGCVTKEEAQEAAQAAGERFQKMKKQWQQNQQQRQQQQQQQ